MPQRTLKGCNRGGDGRNNNDARGTTRQRRHQFRCEACRCASVAGRFGGCPRPRGAADLRHLELAFRNDPIYAVLGDERKSDFP